MYFNTYIHTYIHVHDCHAAVGTRPKAVKAEASESKATAEGDLQGSEKDTGHFHLGLRKMLSVRRSLRRKFQCPDYAKSESFANPLAFLHSCFVWNRTLPTTRLPSRSLRSRRLQHFIARLLESRLETATSRCISTVSLNIPLTSIPLLMTPYRYDPMDLQVETR